MPVIPSGQLLTRDDVAKILGVNVRTVDRYIKEDLLRAFQPPGTNLTRVHPAALEAFLANRPKENPKGLILSSP